MSFTVSEERKPQRYLDSSSHKIETLIGPVEPSEDAEEEIPLGPRDPEIAVGREEAGEGILEDEPPALEALEALVTLGETERPSEEEKEAKEADIGDMIR